MKVLLFLWAAVGWFYDHRRLLLPDILVWLDCTQ